MLRPSPNHGTQRLPNDDDDAGEPRDRKSLVVGVKTQSDKLALQLPVRPTDYKIMTN